MSDDLHQRLVALQSTDELRRKAVKAYTRKHWTQEEIDYGKRRADELYRNLRRRAFNG